MELTITGKNMEVPEAVRVYARRKLGHLDRYIHSISEVRVEFSQEGTRSASDRYVVQVTLSKDSHRLRGEERSANVFAAIDAVADVMARQIARYKGRRYPRNRNARPPVVDAQEPADVAEEPQGKLVKVKRFPVKPMSPEEAIEEMELLGHNFFLFLNASNNQYGVVYRRRDGDYGLIESELL